MKVGNLFTIDYISLSIVLLYHVLADVSRGGGEKVIVGIVRQFGSYQHVKFCMWIIVYNLFICFSYILCYNIITKRKGEQKC